MPPPAAVHFAATTTCPRLTLPGLPPPAPASLAAACTLSNDGTVLTTAPSTLALRAATVCFEGVAWPCAGDHWRGHVHGATVVCDRAASALVLSSRKVPLLGACDTSAARAPAARQQHSKLFPQGGVHGHANPAQTMVREPPCWVAGALPSLSVQRRDIVVMPVCTCVVSVRSRRGAHRLSDFWILCSEKGPHVVCRLRTSNAGAPSPAC